MVWTGKLKLKSAETFLSSLNTVSITEMQKEIKLLVKHKLPTHPYIQKKTVNKAPKGCISPKIILHNITGPLYKYTKTPSFVNQWLIVAHFDANWFQNLKKAFWVGFEPASGYTPSTNVCSFKLVQTKKIISKVNSFNEK